MDFKKNIKYLEDDNDNICDDQQPSILLPDEVSEIYYPL